MKTKSPLLRLNLHQSGLLLAALALLAAPQAQAQLYTGSTNTGLWNSSRWSADTNGPFDTAWVDNSSSVFLADTAYTFTSGTNANIGNVTVGSGASVVFSAVSGTLGTGGAVRTLDVGTNAILDFNSQALSTAAGTGFIKTGDGVYATGEGAFKSGFTLNGGTVVIRATTGLGSGGANVLTLSNGVVAANDNRSLAATRFPGGIFIAGNFQLGALSNSYATNAQALILDTANISFANNVSLQGANRTITLGGNGIGEFSGIISDGGLTVTAGVGVTNARITLTGASANTYTGLTTVSAGGLTLSKTAVNAIAGNVLVDGTGTLTLGASDQIINTSSVEVAAGTLALATFNETVNNLKLTGGTITSTTGVLTSSTAYDFQSSGNVAGILAGTAGANKTTAGTVTFSGGNANTYTGLTTVSAGSLVLSKTAGVVALAGDALVNGGTLQISRDNQIVDTANLEVATGGTFALGGNTDTVNGVKLTGGAITGTGTNGILTSITAYDLQSGSSSAVLAGTAGATKTTAGTVTLTKANTYSGGTTLSDGTLQLGNNTALGTGTVALNGGTLSSDGTANRTILNAVTIGGNVILGNATNDGRLNFSAGVDLGATDRTLTTASSVAFNGAVSGNGGITKAGSATLTLSTNNSYLGNTVLSEGSLIINGDQSSATGALTVASGATLGGSGTIGGATTISGIHSPGNSPGVQTFNSGLTYSAGSTFIWELTGNMSSDRGIAFDGVNVSGGTLTINGGVTNNLVFNGAGSTVNWSDAFWASNQEWLVFSNASSPTLSSNVFATINVGLDTNSQSLTTVRSGSSFSWGTIGDDVYLTYAIPEPSTYALLALLGAGFAGRALVRRRRRHGVD
jgi:autotransporter-associated beta strand protein